MLAHLPNNDEILCIKAQEHPTFHALTENAEYLMYEILAHFSEASVSDRWSLGVYSTSASNRKYAARYHDTSRHSERDLRCLTVLNVFPVGTHLDSLCAETIPFIAMGTPI